MVVFSLTTTDAAPTLEDMPAEAVDAKSDDIDALRHMLDQLGNLCVPSYLLTAEHAPGRVRDVFAFDGKEVVWEEGYGP
jgi:hypothetical protein